MRLHWLPHGVLTILLLVYAGLAGCYNAITPAATTDQHNPDETAHMLYVQSIAAGHLPVFRPAEDSYEAHQPPLYYVLCAPVYLAAKAGGEDVSVRAVRWVSTLIGAFLIVAAYKITEKLLPAEPWLALGTATFIGLLPMNVSLSASVGNDALTNLIFALGLWLLSGLCAGVDSVDARGLRRQAVWLGVVLGAGIWTKTSTLLLFPTVAVALFLLVRQGLLDRERGKQIAGLTLGVGLIIGAPWLIRNQLLYGDPIAQHIFQQAFARTPQAYQAIYFLFHGSMSAYLASVALWTFASFWGVFDSMRLFWGQNPYGHAPTPGASLSMIYNILAILCIGALIGLVRLRPSSAWLSMTSRIVLTAFGVLIALTWLAHLRFIIVYFQAQGRYWYPSLVPLALFFVLGWRGLLPRQGVFLGTLALMTAGLLILNLYTIFGLLLPRFAG